MAKRVLIAYASNAGSTADVARTIGEELSSAGLAAEVRAIADLANVDLAPYAAVLIGAPMILGWHRDATRFVRAHRDALAKVPTAFFATALTLTRTFDAELAGLDIFIDPKLGKPPRNSRRLGLKERYATVGNYLRPMLKSAGRVRPAGIAFFAGKLDFRRLKFVQMLFIMLLLAAQPGDHRNWDAIRSWARELAARLAV